MTPNDFAPQAPAGGAFLARRFALDRLTPRVAISSWRLIAFEEIGITFRYKDYRRDGEERQKVMPSAPGLPETPRKRTISAR